MMASVLCPVCAKTSFSNIEALRLSLVKVATGLLPCPLCSNLFCGLDKLTIHLFSHSISHSIPTSSSSSSTIMKTTQDSKESHHSIPDDHLIAEAPRTEGAYREETAAIVCDICEASFTSEHLREIHFRVMHQCHWRLPTMEDTEQQQQSEQRQEPAELWPTIGAKNDSATILLPSRSQTEAPTNNNKPPPYSYKCHLCAKMYKMKGSLRVHLKVVHSVGVKVAAPPPKIQSLGSIQSQRNLYSEQKHSNKSLLEMGNRTSTAVAEGGGGGGVECASKSWECDVCSKTFTTKYFLKKHKRLHTGEMPYACELCGRTFTFQQSYHKHLLYHSDEKPHICGVCGRAFKELSTLHNHQRIHSGEKPFKCEICGKSFRQRVSFLVHTRIHTGVMPYKCDVCQKRFRYKVSQRTHKCSGLSIPAEMKGGQSISTSPPIISTENLLKSLLDNAAISHVEASTTGFDDQESLSMLTRSIDEFVLESCQLLGITGDHNDNCT